MATTNITCGIKSPNGPFSSFSGGVDPIPAEGPIQKLFITGAWAVNDKVTLDVHVDQTMFNVGNNEMLGLVPTFATVVQSQVLLAIGSRCYLSALDNPRIWEFRTAGFGFIDAAGRDAEAQTITSIGEFSTRVLFFTKSGVQVWLYDPDPVQWQNVQNLRNVKQIGVNSGTSYGDADYFFVADNGPRSIRVREQIDLLNVLDVGTPMNPLFETTLIANPTDVVAGLNRNDGRYVLQFNKSFTGPYPADYPLLVYTSYPGSKINAWSTYQMKAGTTAFYVQQFANYGSLFYIRGRFQGDSDDSIIYYHRGTYDTTQVWVVVPFLDMGKPGHRKKITAVDICGAGTWTVYFTRTPTATKVAAMLGSNPGTLTSGQELSLSTDTEERIPIGINSKYIGMVLQSKATAEEARLSSIILHYDFLDTP